MYLGSASKGGPRIQTGWDRTGRSKFLGSGISCLIWTCCPCGVLGLLLQACRGKGLHKQHR